MTKLSPKLASLATDLMQAIPRESVELWGYINDISLGYIIEGYTTQQPKPSPCPYYGPVFAAALQAVEMGWESRAEYHAERLAKVKRVCGYLPEVKRIERRIGGNPQPTDRRSFDNGHTPRTGNE